MPSITQKDLSSRLSMFGKAHGHTAGINAASRLTRLLFVGWLEGALCVTHGPHLKVTKHEWHGSMESRA